MLSSFFPSVFCLQPTWLQPFAKHTSFFSQQINRIEPELLPVMMQQIKGDAVAWSDMEVKLPWDLCLHQQRTYSAPGSGSSHGGQLFLLCTHATLAGTGVAFLVIFDSRIHFLSGKRIGLLPSILPLCSYSSLNSFCLQADRVHSLSLSTLLLNCSWHWLMIFISVRSFLIM